MEFTADASFAAILERTKLGMAIAAIIKIMATTTNSSIREKPTSTRRTVSNFVCFARRTFMGFASFLSKLHSLIKKGKS